MRQSTTRQPDDAGRVQETDAIEVGRGGRMSRQRKTAAVLRLLRGEDLETVSRSLGVTAATLTAWRDAFLAAGDWAGRLRALLQATDVGWRWMLGRRPPSTELSTLPRRFIHFPAPIYPRLFRPGGPNKLDHSPARIDHTSALGYR